MNYILKVQTAHSFECPDLAPNTKHAKGVTVVE